MATQIERAPLPFRAHDNLALATVGNEQLQFFVVTCPECGAIGPRATSDDPPDMPSTYGINDSDCNEQAADCSDCDS